MNIVSTYSYPFKTDVFHTETGEKCKNLEINKTGLTREGFSEFILKDQSEDLGVIYLDIKKDSIPLVKDGGYVTINYMRNDNSHFKNVGKALHEFAIRYSFDKGCEGRVKLISAYGADGFHYKCGFQYFGNTTHFFDYGKKYEKHIDDYIDAGQDQEKRDIAISNIYKEKVLFSLLKANAEVKLGKEITDNNSIISKGLFVKLHELLERSYYGSKETQYVSGYSEETNEFLRYNQKSIFDRGGIMVLCDTVRLQWKKIIESEQVK